MGCNEPSRQSAAMRIQSRLSIDPEMGEIYDWLINLSPAVRARELLNVARLGHAVQRGQALLIAPAMTGELSAVPDRARPVQAELALSVSPESIDPVQQALQADLLVLAGWSLESMLPPPPSPVQV